MSYISLDSSTSSTTVVVFDDDLSIQKKFQKEHQQIYTPEGFVEHDLEEIYNNLIELIKKAAEIAPDPHLISITNQRETFALFDKLTGKPVRNAVVWQCTRGKEICEKILNNIDNSELITQKTGLRANTFFSASKLKWVMENEPHVKEGLKKGKILFGTIDTYLLYRLTKCKEYVTDTTNASRTLLFNCIDNHWDNELFSIFEIEQFKLAEVQPSSSNFGSSNFENSFLKEISISGVAGDAQAPGSCVQPGTAVAGGLERPAFQQQCGGGVRALSPPEAGRGGPVTRAAHGAGQGVQPWTCGIGVLGLGSACAAATAGHGAVVHRCSALHWSGGGGDAIAAAHRPDAASGPPTVAGDVVPL